jgi:hypothetical protein
MRLALLIRASKIAAAECATQAFKPVSWKLGPRVVAESIRRPARVISLSSTEPPTPLPRHRGALVGRDAKNPDPGDPTRRARRRRHRRGHRRTGLALAWDPGPKGSASSLRASRRTDQVADLCGRPFVGAPSPRRLPSSHALASACRRAPSSREKAAGGRCECPCSCPRTRTCLPAVP